MNEYMKYRLALKNGQTKPPLKKPVTIKPVSAKRAKINLQYSEKSRPYWKGKQCEIRSPVCTHQAQGIHHRKGKATTALLMDERYWMAACNFCNTYVENHDSWARKMGYKLSRI